MSKRIRTTKFVLSKDVTDEGVRARLEELFDKLETSKRVSVEEYRKVAEAMADFDIAKAQATKSMGQFLRLAGGVIPMVAVEPVWWAYRTKDGEIILECALTERDLRNSQRAQKAGLQREVKSTDADGIFEDDDETEDVDEPGFK